MASSRLPRFKRASIALPFELTERDREIIRHIHRHRFLRSSHICSLIPGSSQQLLRRLKLLYHHGYLERPRIQLEYYHEGGSHEFVYGLSGRGASLIRAEIGCEPGTLLWDTENGSIGRVFLKHALLVSDVMVAIELACREKRIRLLTGPELAPSGDKSRRRFRWNVTVAAQKLSAVPDRVFALEFEGSDANPRRSYFFLEADRGTMPVIRKDVTQTSFYRKLAAYEATWTQSLHEKLFGFYRFRVLTVTTSAKRVESLIEACSKLKSGHGLFLFTDTKVLEAPRDILSSVWHSGRAGETGTLLD
jgi:hypothetical protein